MQGRNPPAYQEYAASMLAKREFRIMSLAERGLLYTLRMECWENGSVPASTTELARYLGVEINEIKSLLTERVKMFFYEDSGSLSCSELDDYKKHLQERRDKQKNGGKKGAAIANAKRSDFKKGVNNDDKGKLTGNPPGNLRLTKRVVSGSLVKQNKVQQSKTQSLDTCLNNSWIDDYTNNESLIDNEYLRIKDGS